MCVCVCVCVCVLCAVCCVLCAVCCVLCAVRCVLCCVLLCGCFSVLKPHGVDFAGECYQVTLKLRKETKDGSGVQDPSDTLVEHKVRR